MQAASAVDYEKVAQILLDAGAHINAQGGRDGSTLLLKMSGIPNYESLFEV